MPQRPAPEESDDLLRVIAAEMARSAALTGCPGLSGAVAQAMRAVPREAFVPREERPRAYENVPLPIGHAQTISQPFVVALMTELLQTEPGDVVLEIGTGSGYETAILAHLVREVYTVERVPDLAQRAREQLARLGLANVHVRTGDGYEGWPEHAPYDGVMVTAAAPHVPPRLVEQLAPGARMVIPLGEPGGVQVLAVVTKEADGSPRTREVLPVAFVPLVPGDPA